MENKSGKTYNNPFIKMEEEAGDFWEKSRTFEKSVANPPADGGEAKNYVFYDGPPFATGEPHYGHILSSVSKDVVPRFWTMRGYRVERRWGWDCHGLPIENIVEADLKISGKKQIEEMGIDKFNEACRARVLEYADIWGKMIRRIGRWVDFENSYKTMDLTFMESVWWGFKAIYEKGLIYEGRKVLLYCPRCETPISNFEVAMDNSYKDVTDRSVFVMFKLKTQNSKLKTNNDNGTHILAWTTTPWTLPGNAALAVGSGIKYLVLSIKGKEGNYVVAKDRAGEVLKGMEYEIAEELDGKDLVGLEYEPLFDLPAMRESGQNLYRVLEADFVTTADGTGIVHIAPMYGEDDFKAGQKHGLPVVPNLDEKGHFNDTVPQYAGTYFKKANGQVIEDLESKGLLFREEDITHSYPHCHRCNTALFYNAIPAWFIDIAKLRTAMLEQNEKINWYPGYLKQGRFAKGIENAPDWNISRNRYFATPMPVWRCDACGELEIIGSVKELEEKSGQAEVSDIHSHFIDHLSWKCSKCEGGMRRIREVFDCWVESGSMPFAQNHYPFENKEKFEANFPAQYISEYISQTRAWFYVMHVISTALFGKNSFENVVTTGVILNEKGEKMSKSKKNFPDPWKVLDQFGADALRLYLMSSTVMHADNLYFNENDLKDLFRKYNMLVWNVYNFYKIFPLEGGNTGIVSENILDKWIISRLNRLIGEVTTRMEDYDLPRSVRPIGDFIDELSNWYLRRSRDRFKSDSAEERLAASSTLRTVLIELSKVMAPFAPFLAENIWQRATGNDFNDPEKSVHLEAWPKAGETDAKITERMELARRLVEIGLARRDEAGVKIRQPLKKAVISGVDFELETDYLELVKDELNVKEVFMKKGDNDEPAVSLDTLITDELKMEGVKRELVRHINALRKEAGMTVRDKAVVGYETEGALLKKTIQFFAAEIARDTLSEKVAAGVPEKSAAVKEVKIESEAVKLGVENKGE